MFAAARDITELKRIDRVIQEKADLAKSEFLSSMSHELRTPLNAILGFAQLMDTEVPPATLTQKSSIEQILNAGWYLLELINEILDLAMLESGKAPLSEEPISLEEIMLECQAMVEPLAEKRGIMLSFPQVNRDFFVRADRTRLKQVVINLLTNAIKYNQSSGTVVVECGLRPHNRTRITISDTGAGLSPEKLAQLFQPFNRLGQEGSTEEGTGIGLVVSKRVVEMMGGVIGVASVVGVGSSFWFELHSASAPERLADGAGVMPASAMQGSTDAQRTVLCVEDSPANMRFIDEFLGRRPGLRMIGAENAKLGIEIAQRELPDLILMDINLPGMSGLEAMKALRGDPTTAHIPVLALSAYALPRDIENGLAAGFFRYITKPIKLEDFTKALDMALEFIRVQREAQAGSTN